MNLMFMGSGGEPGCMEMTQETDVPDLRETPGGWLAVAVDSPRIAVVADTRDGALAKFRTERAEWRELISKAQREHATDAE
jgi:hypothetical protein